MCVVKEKNGDARKVVSAFAVLTTDYLAQSQSIEGDQKLLTTLTNQLLNSVRDKHIVFPEKEDRWGKRSIIIPDRTLKHISSQNQPMLIL